LTRHVHARGFTLIELSIVLVIIGLIAGGILTGRDLIRAAEARATISQIERYNTAANTFREKYGYLPGDIKDPEASQFGFAARGLYAGEGDGNGVIEGAGSDGPNRNYGYTEGFGETTMFWVDVSAAHLIDGSFNTATPLAAATLITSTTIPSLDAYFPAAKLGNGNSVLVWSGGIDYTAFTSANNGINYFGLWKIVDIGATGTGGMESNPGLTVAQAYQIDKKMDDGLARTGAVTAVYVGQPGNASYGWGADGGGPYYHGGFLNTNVPASPTTCYDNGNDSTMPMQYSMSQNGGAGVNCMLSFQFQ
jgi:prepilin-type N-terminal cleavage/methylation domain-containing protein